jgi:hypothetical protein
MHPTRDTTAVKYDQRGWRAGDAERYASCHTRRRVIDMEESSLTASDKRRAGHYEILGETLAKFEFFENGWNPYARFLDVDKVDLIVRRVIRGVPDYREIQVKYGKLYDCDVKWELPLFDVTSWRFFRKDEFANFVHRTDFFIAYVLAHDTGYKGDIFIFPVADFHKILIAESIPTGERVKTYISRSKADSSRWFLRRKNKFEEICDETCYEVTRYRRNFGLLGTAKTSKSVLNAS